MAQTCTKCSRANPDEASYCYYDGSILGDHRGNGPGPVFSRSAGGVPISNHGEFDP